jgi:hypothetical protein
MTLGLGLRADYASLIDKQQIESLKMTGEADKYAKKLLAADAYLGLGTANYVIGGLPVHKRFLLAFAVIHGDKHVGIQQLEIAAMSGHYLRPFAKILLALAALREKNAELARRQLAQPLRNSPKIRSLPASWPNSGFQARARLSTIEQRLFCRRKYCIRAQSGNARNL